LARSHSTAEAEVTEREEFELEPKSWIELRGRETSWPPRLPLLPPASPPPTSRS